MKNLIRYVSFFILLVVTEDSYALTLDISETCSPDSRVVCSASGVEVGEGLATTHEQMPSQAVPEFMVDTFLAIISLLMFPALVFPAYMFLHRPKCVVPQRYSGFYEA